MQSESPFPKAFIEYASENLGVASDERFNRLLRLAWSRLHIPPINRHRFHEDCFFQRKTDIEQWFGRSYQAYLAQTGLIAVRGDYSRSESTTYPYQVTARFEALVVAFAKETLPSLNIDHWLANAPPTRVPKKAISSRDARDGDHKRATRCQIPAFVPLDTLRFSELVLAYPRWLRDAEQSPTNRHYKYKRESEPAALVAHTLGFLNRLVLDRQTGFVGVLEQYTESHGGRLFARGTSLQTAPKRFRRAVFTGHTEWDFDACHPTIIASLGAQYGCPTEALAFYNPMREQMRLKLARETGASRGQVKTAITALLYGALPSIYEDSALRKILGDEHYDEFTDHWFVKRLMAELTAIGKVIVDRHTKSATKYLPRRIHSPLGKEKAIPGVSLNKHLAFIIQGYEALMLDTVVSSLADEDGITRRVALLQHDGWTTREPALDELSGALDTIEERTGIRMGVDHEELRLSENLQASS